MERLITIGLGIGNIVVILLRQNREVLLHNRERFIALLDGFDDDSNRTDVKELIKAQVLALLEKHQLRYTVDWWLSGQPFLTARGKLVDAVVNAVEHYNEIKPQLLTTGGTSDGRFIARMGAQVVELGPVNATIHKINECVNAADLQLLARMYQRIMEQLVA